MDRSLFTSQMSDSLESLESHADPALSEIAAALTLIRAVFYERRWRDIDSNILAILETDLRNIIKKIDTYPDIKKLIASKSLAKSTDKVLFELGQARNKLDLATDVLEQRFTTKRREQLYQYYDQICVHLDTTINFLQNTQ